MQYIQSSLRLPLNGSRLADGAEITDAVGKGNQYYCEGDPYSIVRTTGRALDGIRDIIDHTVQTMMLCRHHQQCPFFAHHIQNRSNKPPGSLPINRGYQWRVG